LTVFDGSETICLGERLGETYRFYSCPGMSAIEELSMDEDRLCQSAAPWEERKAMWREMVRERQANGSLWPLGQDACFARGLAERFVTVAGIIQAIGDRSRRQLETARRLRPLAENAPLAVRHKTRYPIVQGPMTRVSDTAVFANAVADAGGLPFLALALSRKAEVEKLGAMGTARVTAVDRWLRGTLGDDLGTAVRGMMVTAKIVEGFEKLMTRMSGQGVASFTQSGRDTPAANGSIPGFEKMSFAQQRQAQDAMAQRRR
jgi:hypothetical protein